MKKIIAQFLVLLALFLGIWFGLSRIDFVNDLKINDKTEKIEQALGNFYLDIIENTQKQVTDSTIIDCVEQIKNRLCRENKIDSVRLKVYVLQSDEVNAYALPNHQIVINSALIKFCKNAEELAGVMAHELAHIEKNHIMIKLSKEVGYAALAAILNSGSTGDGLRLLTSTAYDRKLETQADEMSVEYMIQSKINPTPLADFMYRLSLDENDLLENLTFILTHPGTEERAKKIIEQVNQKSLNYVPLLPDIQWSQLCGNI